MAIQPKNTLKSFFGYKKKPTQANFTDFIDTTIANTPTGSGQDVSITSDTGKVKVNGTYLIKAGDNLSLLTDDITMIIDHFNQGGIAVTADSTEIRPALDTGKRALIFITNAGANDAYVSFGSEAVVGEGTLLKSGQSMGFDGVTLWNGTINAISADSTTITFNEGVTA